MTRIDDRRRRLLALASLAALPGMLAAPRTALAHDSAGPVEPPVAASDERLVTATGERTTLARLLGRGPTAVQFMFTGCSDICPIQGAMFAEAQRQLRAAGLNEARLLSISIDALGDGPAQLARWLAKHSAARGWEAAVPAPDGVERLLRLMDGPGSAPFPPGDIAAGFAGHSQQVYLFDRNARLVWRTAALPEPEMVVAWFRRGARG